MTARGNLGCMGALTLAQVAAWLEGRLAPARVFLGDEAAERAWAEGSAMTPEHAVAYALDRATPA